MNVRVALVALCAVSLAGCFEEASVADVPLPVAMTEEAVGHYCQMDVLEHDGPKAQLHVARLDAPLWFTQVRDALAFMRLPEETDEVTAIYVSDMGRAAQWNDPGAENWIDANKAYFVIDSRRTGGMGAPEAIPFGTQDAADQFIDVHGGRVAALGDIPDDYVLGPVSITFGDDLADPDADLREPVRQ